MKNLLIINHSVLYLFINDKPGARMVYTRRPNQTEFTIEFSTMPFERMEERLLDKSLQVDHYEYTSASNPTELIDPYPELFL